MKTKFSSNRELVHIWANNAEPSINKSANSVSCQFDRLFSYATCIGEIVGNTVILNTYSYSNSTSKHQILAREAVRHMDKIYLSIPGYNHSTLVFGQDTFNTRIVEPCLKSVGEYLVKASRSRKYADWNKAEALSIVANLKKYADLLGLQFSAPDLSEYQEAALRADKVRKEQEKIRKAEKIKQQAEDLARWKAGEDVRSYFEVTALRIKGDEIETSRGAKIPVDHAVRAWPILKRLFNKGAELSPSHTLKLGHYTVNRITDKALIVGCHTIPFSEVENIAAQLHI